MSNILKKHKTNLIIIGIYLILIILISLLNCFFLPISISKYILFLSTLIMAFILSFKEGKKRLNKGFVGGIKVSMIILLSLIIMDMLLIRSSYNLSKMIYYLIICLVAILGSVIGINKKAN